MKEINFLNKITENLEKFPTVQNTFIKNWASVISKNNTFNTEMEKLAKTIADNSSLVQNHFQKLGEMISKVYTVPNRITENISKNLDNFLKYYDDLDNNIELAAKDGWYLSESMIDYICGNDELKYIKNILRNWSNEKVKREFTRETIKKVEISLIKLQNNITLEFPNRKKIIANIFNLHKKKNYIASIPLALTQIDGMCKDIFIECGFYSTNRTKSNKQIQKIWIEISKQEKKLMKTITGQFSSENRNDFVLLRGNNKNLKEFNRHTIMHGESVDYGIKVNSIKSILLLDFIRGLKEAVEIK